ncbi:MAG: VWA domain-containing protein [Kofleriaceae bacterium]|nr:VWA domain-containing protein [Myxococcales bacterium]MCB9561598.1 VWA domain-containing protein [Kofleriaceae bacterium]MCB9572986.1 VWA domain-containing protein [Kofleriaceae bacterium]
MRHFQLLGSLLLATGGLLAAACGNSNGHGPCVGVDPNPVCGQACDAVANPCPTGFFCAADGTCYAECSPGGAGCGDNEVCTIDGVCEALVDADCPNVTLDTSRTTPTVQLLIDQSGSMTSSFGNTDRWSAMVDALVDAMDGVVTNTQGSVIFGASLYTYDENVDQTCPRITGVPRALNNLAAIRTLLQNNQPQSDTPTGDSIDVIVDDFMANPPAPNSPPIIILATDGEPDTCEQPNPQNGQAEAIAAAKRAYTNGIRLYILGVSSDVGTPHLQDMANAGVGNDPQQSGTDAPYFTANSPAELASQLQQIVGGVLSCELNLDGAIDPAQVGNGDVELNGVSLTFGTDWELVDSDTIRLIGQACDDLLGDSNANVTATFPCGVVVN